MSFHDLKTHKISPFTLQNGDLRFRFPAACSAKALSWLPPMRASRKLVARKSHGAHTLT